MATEGSFDWDTNTAKAYTNDTITVNAVTDLATAPAFTVSDPTVLSATPNTTGSAWTIRGKSAGTATITIDTTNIQSSISTLTVTVEDGHYLNQRGLARVWNKIKTLLSGFVTADDGTTTEPVTATVSTAMIQDGAVTTAKLATGAVTADKIDFDSLKPRWKVVATSTTRTVSIPLDYRMYRISFCYTKSSSSTWGTIACPESSGTTYVYVQGVTNGTWVRAERNFAASSDHAVMDGARDANVTSGFSQWRIQLARASTTATSMNAIWQTMTNASLTYNTGRSTFGISSGTGSITLQAETGSGYLWIVEALDV